MYLKSVYKVHVTHIFYIFKSVRVLRECGLVFFYPVIYFNGVQEFSSFGSPGILFLWCSRAVQISRHRFTRLAFELSSPDSRVYRQTLFRGHEYHWQAPDFLKFHYTITGEAGFRAIIEVLSNVTQECWFS